MRAMARGAHERRGEEPNTEDYQARKAPNRQDVTKPKGEKQLKGNRDNAGSRRKIPKNKDKKDNIYSVSLEIYKMILPP